MIYLEFSPSAIKILVKGLFINAKFRREGEKDEKFIRTEEANATLEKDDWSYS